MTTDRVEKPKLIMGRAFIQGLIDAGIIVNEPPIRRVLIDADMNKRLTVLVEHVGDDQLIAAVELVEPILPESVT